MTKKIRVGQRAPDVALMTIEEKPIQLSKAWDGQHALIIFLRHLA